MELEDIFICAVLGCVFLGLLVLSIIAWKKKWTYMNWLLSLATVGVAVIGVLFNSFLYSAGNYPFLRDPPVETELPGTYMLEPDSARSLYEKGYTNLTAQIILKNDKTFEIRHMPHLWFYGGSYRAGCDTCYGTWNAQRISANTTYDVVATIKRFAADSACESDPDKGSGFLGYVLLGIAAKTKKRQDYALAVPLNWGDSGYILFTKLKWLIQSNQAAPRRDVVPGAQTKRDNH